MPTLTGLSFRTVKLYEHMATGTIFCIYTSNFKKSDRIIFSGCLLGGNMKIKVKYDELVQTQNLCGNFIFIREDGVIHNLEATW